MSSGFPGKDIAFRADNLSTEINGDLDSKKTLKLTLSKKPSFSKSFLTLLDNLTTGYLPIHHVYKTHKNKVNHIKKITINQNRSKHRLQSAIQNR